MLGDERRPVRVLIADDQTLVRAGFRMVLEHSRDIEVVGEAADGAEAVDLARRLRPSVVLMDIRMPRMNGLEATREILRQGANPDTHVIVLTTFDQDDYIREALAAGAAGFVLKDVEPEELRRAVRVVASGEALLDPAVTRRVIAEFVERRSRPRRDPHLLDLLTQREREVMELVARGLDNDEISDELYISRATVKTHVNRAMTKLGVHDRAHLVVVAYETGLVEP